MNDSRAGSILGLNGGGGAKDLKAFPNNNKVLSLYSYLSYLSSSLNIARSLKWGGGVLLPPTSGAYNFTGFESE